MKSKASFKSHPLHPILVCFPIAFFIGTLVFDLMGWANNDQGYWQTGFHLEIAGLIGGVLAGIPGAIDYFITVPPRSSAKNRATKHAVLNLSMLIVFMLALLFRMQGNISPAALITLEVIGVIIIFIAGWLGGTLVYRNEIGVDRRYANAGKWNEETIESSNGQARVAEAGELKTNQMKLVHVNRKRIVVARSEDGYRAFDDRCTHKGGTLAGGSMICGTVQCPWHGSQFDTGNGQVKAGPAKEPIKTYEVREIDGKIYVML